MDFKKEKIQEIIQNPRSWAEKVAEKEIVRHIDRYKKAKELGIAFAKEITDEI